MRDKPVSEVQDYTIAFLVSCYPIVLMVLIAVWATAGFLVALLLSYGAHLYLTRRLEVLTERAAGCTTGAPPPG